MPKWIEVTLVDDTGFGMRFPAMLPVEKIVVVSDLTAYAERPMDSNTMILLIGQEKPVYVLENYARVRTLLDE